VEARSDLLAEDRNLPGGIDAQAHLTVIQLHHRHDDPIVDHDPLTKFARQDQRGYGSSSRGLGTILINERWRCKYLDFLMQ
jgi:hypothetical protein